MIPQCSLIAFPVGGKKKVTTTTLYFFPKSFTAIKEKKKKIKKTFAVCMQHYGVGLKNPVSFFSACNSREQITAVVFYYFNYLL